MGSLPPSPTTDPVGSLSSDLEFFSLHSARGRGTPSDTDTSRSTPPLLEATPPPTFPDTPWMDEVDWTGCLAPIDLLDREITEFVRYIAPDRVEVELRTTVFGLFARVIQAVWPDANCGMFGSSATGLFLPDGDIDLVIQSAAIMHLPTSFILETVEAALASTSFALTTRCIPEARVPIVKFTTTRLFGGFHCDVSFQTDNGMRGANVMLRVLEELGPTDAERARSLMFLLKALLVDKGLMEVKTGGLGGMSLFCMVVHFIQQQKKMMEVRLTRGLTS